MSLPFLYLPVDTLFLTPGLAVIEPVSSPQQALPVTNVTVFVL